ncbi:hypothetical protein ACR9HU_23880 (plasmid) [Enterobacter ludwigii]|jgi:hypothetical protein
MTQEEKALFVFGKTLEVIKMTTGGGIGISNIEADFYEYYPRIEVLLNSILPPLPAGLKPDRDSTSLPSSGQG